MSKNRKTQNKKAPATTSADGGVAVKTRKVIDTNKYKNLPTKAAKIRAMSADGHSVGDIARSLGVIYQHAYNTVKRGLKAA